MMLTAVVPDAPFFCWDRGARHNRWQAMDSEPHTLQHNWERVSVDEARTGYSWHITARR